METECDNSRLYAFAASDGNRNALMLSSLTGKAQELTVEGVELGAARYYVIDGDRLLSWAPNARTIEKILSFLLNGDN